MAKLPMSRPSKALRALPAVAVFVAGGFMSADTTTQRADQIFRTGPETLVAASSSIVAGPISHYSKEILKSTESDPDSLPVEWKVTGEIDAPRTLKGTPRPSPLRFSRIERSFLSATRSPAPYWAQPYGELSSSGGVVLFYSSEDGDAAEVLPSGAGELDLAALVKDIVSIQSIAEPKRQIDRWLAYLGGGHGDTAARVALRSLAHLSVEWPQLEPAIKKILSGPNVSRDTRDYAFAFSVFRLSHDAWQKEAPTAVEFLCSSFQAQKDPKSQLRYLDSLSLLFDYYSRQPIVESRRPLRQRVENCWKAWANSGIADPQAVEEYKRLRQLYKLQ
jgi:hypothetical protein